VLVAAGNCRLGSDIFVRVVIPPDRRNAQNTIDFPILSFRSSVGATDLPIYSTFTAPPQTLGERKREVKSNREKTIHRTTCVPKKLRAILAGRKGTKFSKGHFSIAVVKTKSLAAAAAAACRSPFKKNCSPTIMLSSDTLRWPCTLL
jgi:hypothetical protein